HAVRGRRGTAGRGPHLDFTGRWVEAAEIPTLEVRKVDGVVGSDCHAPRACTFWKRIFGDVHGTRIDAGHLVGVEFAEKRNALAVNGDSIRMRVGGWRLFKFGFSGCRIEASNKVACLNREPENTVRIKGGSVRIFGFGIRHFELRDFTGARVEFAN